MPSAFNHFIFQMPHVRYTAINSYTCGYTITACVKNGTGIPLEHTVWQHSGKSIYTIFQLVCVSGIALFWNEIISHLFFNLPFSVKTFSIAVDLNVIFRELRKFQFKRNSNQIKIHLRNEIDESWCWESVENFLNLNWIRTNNFFFNVFVLTAFVNFIHLHLQHNSPEIEYKNL